MQDQYEIIRLFENRNSPAWGTVDSVEELAKALEPTQIGVEPNDIVGLFYPDFESDEAKAFKSAALRWAIQNVEAKVATSGAPLGSRDRYIMSKSMKVIKALKAKPPAAVYVSGGATAFKNAVRVCYERVECVCVSKYVYLRLCA